MIRTVEIKTVEDASELILDRAYDTEINRLRSHYLFRGMPDASYPMLTSLRRNCKEKEQLLELSILKNFAKYASISDPAVEKSVWRQMTLGQHHGLPTRLLDWTHSALIALHFATAEADMEDTDKRDGIVWRIDARELAGRLPDKYREKLWRENTFIFSVESLSEVAPTLERYDEDMNGASMVLVEPPSTDQRIINQYAYFSPVPMGMDRVDVFLEGNTEHTVKYIIDRQVRWDLRDILDQYNISERIIYPGLDGLSRWIGRHYYVKSSKK